MVRDLLQHAEDAARAGGAVLRRWYGDADLVVDRKASSDFVTGADRESEAAIVGALTARYPDHAFLAEEGGRSGGGDYEWVIDPLDGTTNFLEGLPVWSVSVACRHRGETVVGVVYDPLRDDLFAASRGGGASRGGAPIAVTEQPGVADAFLATGYPFRARAALDLYLGVFRDVFLEARAIRRCGSAAIDLAYTAAGVFDGFFEFKLSAWDIAAGALLIEEAGGRVSDLDGGRGFLESGNVVAGAPGVQRDLLERVAAHVDEALIERLVPDAGGSPAEVPA